MRKLVSFLYWPISRLVDFVYGLAYLIDDYILYPEKRKTRASESRYEIDYDAIARAASTHFMNGNVNARAGNITTEEEVNQGLRMK